MNTFFTFCRHPDFFMAGLADFGFFLLFDEVDDDEREEYDEQKRCLTYFYGGPPDGMKRPCLRL